MFSLESAKRASAILIIYSRMLNDSTAVLKASKHEPNICNTLLKHGVALYSVAHGRRAEADIQLLRDSVSSKICANFPEADQAAAEKGACIKLAIEDMMAQQTICVTSLGKFLETALEAFQHLEACSMHVENTEDITKYSKSRRAQDRPEIVGVFTNAWALVFTMCAWFSAWLPSDNPFLGNHMELLSPHLHAWMTWLLLFLKGRSRLFTTLQILSNDGVWQVGPLSLLSLATNQLFTIQNNRSLESQHTLLDLPTGFTDTLCTLFCELAYNPATSLDTKLKPLALNLGRMLRRCVCSSDSLLHPEFVSPAAVQIAKLALLYASLNGTYTTKGMLLRQDLVLEMLERRNMLDLSTLAGVSGTATAPKQLCSDKRMLSAVCLTSSSNPCAHSTWSGCILEFVWLVMLSWDRDNVGQGELECLPTLLRHCMLQLASWMGQQRTQGVDSHNKPAALNSTELWQIYDLWLEAMTLWLSTSALITAGQLGAADRNAQLSQQQLTAESQMPEVLTLQASLRMPGFVTVLESLVRESSRSQPQRLIDAAVCIAPMLDNTEPLNCVAAQISMITSFVKGTCTNTQQRTPCKDDMVASFECLAQALQSVLSCISQEKASCINISLDSTIGSHEGLSCQDDQSSKQPGIAQSNTHGIPYHLELERMNCLIHSLHKLSAILVHGMVRLFNILLMLSVDLLGEVHAAFYSKPEWIKRLEGYDAELAAVALQLLLLPSGTSGWPCVKTVARLEPIVWASYAIKHFHGRLLPGCCHLGCINLSGISECCVPTLLCSGCRRVRYCSVACQQAAWLDGGHGEVCGKGEWAVPKDGLK